MPPIQNNLMELYKSMVGFTGASLPQVPVLGWFDKEFLQIAFSSSTSSCKWLDKSSGFHIKHQLYATQTQRSYQQHRRSWSGCNWSNMKKVPPAPRSPGQAVIFIAPAVDGSEIWQPKHLLDAWNWHTKLLLLMVPEIPNNHLLDVFETCRK